MENEGEREKGEANNFMVSFSALLKDVANILDFMGGLNNEEDQNVVNVADHTEGLKFVLAFICTFVQLSYSDLEQFENTMSASRQVVKNLLRQILNDVDNNLQCKYNIHHVLPSLMDNINDSVFPLVTLYEILQNVCSNMRDFHGLVVNGYVDQDIVKYVLPQFPLMAERVRLFLWDDRFKRDSRLFKLANLLLKIIPIELEVMHICYTNLKASTSAEVACFIKQLLEISLGILREYLIHLQEHMVAVITPSTSGARNIHVMIEFLLIILTDVPKDIIHHEKLLDLLAHVGSLTREVSTLVRDIEEKSKSKGSTNRTNRETLDLLKNIELLKEDLKYVYLKAPDPCQWCFPMSDGPLFMHLLHIHLNDLLDSNAYSISLIKEEIELVKEDLEFIRLFFVNAKQRLHKDLWARVLDAAYGAKDVIDSIIVRDNGLLHLIFSLPITTRKIKLIKEEVSNLPEKVPKNKSLIVVNSPKKPVGSKPLTAGKIVVGFEEETQLIISKLTSVAKDLDVISIIGMPGSGKTTLAYKVYNDESVSTRFDIRAWCTVGQEYDKRNLLEKVYNQVTGPDSKLSENIDVADELRRHLIGKRYLIVLDDLWDTDAWDKLTRPFPLVENGSRIILTSRDTEVGLYGKRSTDPLNLRLLRPEESWELLEKRAFGNDCCPDELLEVVKEIAENCKGLPLVSDLIFGVIAGREKKKSEWLEVRNNLNSFSLNSEVDVMKVVDLEVMKVIELSYEHLPNHLKPCLLYLARFPKDTTMETDELKMYWHAEGLVELTEMMSVEEVMEVYLDNLISSSLVILFNKRGNHPTCQLHDLVHYFCFIKARKEKLFEWISSSDRCLQHCWISSSDLKHK
ncbi:putative late blight resistance protein R1A-10 isoform X2 [Capsicum chacoense]